MTYIIIGLNLNTPTVSVQELDRLGKIRIHKNLNTPTVSVQAYVDGNAEEVVLFKYTNCIGSRVKVIV